MVFLLEEPYAREMLKGTLPTILPSPHSVSVTYITFHGKYDLEKRLEGKLRGWLKPQTLFVVLRDQDQGDCKDIKRQLVAKCNRTGKADALVRIACRNWKVGILVICQR